MQYTDDYETSKGLRRTLESVAHRAGRVYRVRGGGVIIATSHNKAEARDFAYGDRLDDAEWQAFVADEMGL